MALIEVDPVDDPLDDLIHWGAVEDNVGGLSPDLQGEPGASVGQGGLDLLGDPTADMCDTTGMSGALEFLARPLALVGVGVIWLLVAADDDEARPSQSLLPRLPERAHVVALVRAQ